jgi:hypothetical protein
MQCRINPRLTCLTGIKTGKAYWQTSVDCLNCPTLLKAKQTPLEVYEGGERKMKEKSQTWVQKRVNQLKEARKQALKAKGYEELFVFPQGETTIQVCTDNAPREQKTVNGMRDILRIMVGEKLYDWMVNPASKIYLQVLEEINAGKSCFIIVRTGEKKETRYSIKKSW